MASASLTADLLARKGRARPTGKWLRSSQVMMAPAPAASNDPCVLVETKPEEVVVVNKHLRIGAELNRRLKLLAARTDQSQQAIMEKAVRHYLMLELEKADCICGSDL